VVHGDRLSVVDGDLQSQRDSMDPLQSERPESEMQIEDVYERQWEAVRLSRATNVHQRVIADHDEELREGLKPPAARMEILEDALSASLPTSPVSEGQIEGAIDEQRRESRRRRRKHRTSPNVLSL